MSILRTKAMRYIKIVGTVIGLLLGSAFSWCSADANSVEFCQLVENPAKYDGARISVIAVYSYGYEWQELTCMECRSKGKTWLTFHPEAIDKVRKQLKKAPRHQGIISGRFTGVFHGTGGPYGDGSFKYEFEVEGIFGIRTLARDWKTPLAHVGGCKELVPGK